MSVDRHVFHRDDVDMEEGLPTIAASITFRLIRSAEGDYDLCFFAFEWSALQQLAFLMVAQESVPAGSCKWCWGRREMIRLFSIGDAPEEIIRDFLEFRSFYTFCPAVMDEDYMRDAFIRRFEHVLVCIYDRSSSCFELLLILFLFYSCIWTDVLMIFSGMCMATMDGRRILMVRPIPCVNFLILSNFLLSKANFDDVLATFAISQDDSPRLDTELSLRTENLCGRHRPRSPIRWLSDIPVPISPVVTPPPPYSF